MSIQKRTMGSCDPQAKHSEWYEQWTLFQDDERSLFEAWIAPVAMDDFRGKTVLECGCGGGQHTSYMAPLATSITAVDLNTAQVAKERKSRLRISVGRVTTRCFDRSDVRHLRTRVKHDT